MRRDLDRGKGRAAGPDRVQEVAPWSLLRTTRCSFGPMTVRTRDSGCVSMPSRLTQIQPSVPIRTSLLRLPGRAGTGGSAPWRGPVHEIDLDAIGVGVLDILGADGIANVVFVYRAGALHGDRRGVVGVVGPLGDIEIVDTPTAADAPARNRRWPAKNRNVRKSLYGTQGAGPSHMSQSKPGGGSWASPAPEGGCAGAADDDFLELADLSVAHQLAGDAEIEAGALLGAELEDHAIPLDRRANGLGILDREGQGFS